MMSWMELKPVEVCPEKGEATRSCGTREERCLLAELPPDEGSGRWAPLGKGEQVQQHCRPGGVAGVSVSGGPTWGPVFPLLPFHSFKLSTGETWFVMRSSPRRGVEGPLEERRRPPRKPERTFTGTQLALWSEAEKQELGFL